MAKKRSGWRICLIVLALLVLAVFGTRWRLEANMQKLADLKISEVDWSGLPDGVYPGRFEAFPVEAAVRVTLQGGRITAIELVEHRNGQGAAAETIPAEVVAAQSLAVDLVAGATYSSKVILKAIEVALRSGAM